MQLMRRTENNTMFDNLAPLLFKGIGIFCRVVACLYVAMIALAFVGRISIKLNLMPLVYTFSNFLPDVLQGRWVIPTPLDGVFHTDFAIFVVILFALDWIFTTIGKSLKKRTF